MADNDGSLVIGIELDDGTIKKVQADASALAKAIGGDLSGVVGKGIDRSMTGLITQFRFVADMASKAFGVVSGVVHEAVTEATKAEASMSRFNNVLANAGHYTAAASADFEDFARGLERVGTVSHDAVIEASTSLISIGGLTGESLKKATQAAVNLSAGLNIDLNSAFNMVAKSAEGNNVAMQKAGLRIDATIPKAHQFAATLQLINSKFNGLDVAKANTFEGAFTKFDNAIKNAYESMGKLVTGSAPITAIIKKISEIIGRLTTKFDDLKGQNIFDSMVKGAISFANTITQMLLPPLEVLYNGGVVIFAVFKTGLQAVVSLVAMAALGWAEMGNAVHLVSDEQLAAVQMFSDNANTILAGFANDTGAAVSGVFQTTVADTIIPVLDEINAAAQNADPLAPMVANTTTAAAKINAEVAALTKKIDDMVKNGVVKSISAGVQMMVSNIAKGKNAFAGVLGAIGNIMGDMAISIGETLVLAGLGMEALQKSIVGMTGGPALFAGIALIALGSLLKSLSGGGGAGATSTAGAGGGGSASPTAVDSVSAGDPNAVARNNATQVNLTVQGNILDRRETGLELASVLTDYFDTNDGVVAKA